MDIPLISSPVKTHSLVCVVFVSFLFLLARKGTFLSEKYIINNNSSRTIRKMFRKLPQWFIVFVISSHIVVSSVRASIYHPAKDDDKMKREAIVGGAVGGGLGGVLDAFVGHFNGNKTYGFSTLGATIGGGVGGYKDRGNSSGVLGSAVGSFLGVEILASLCYLFVQGLFALGGGIAGGLGFLEHSIGFGAGAAEGLTFGEMAIGVVMNFNLIVGIVLRSLIGGIGGGVGAYYGSDFYFD